MRLAAAWRSIQTTGLAPDVVSVEATPGGFLATAYQGKQRVLYRSPDLAAWTRLTVR